MKFQLILLLTLVGPLTTNCANMFKYQPYARSVKKQPNQGGVIALRLNHRQEDQQKAKQIMSHNCGSKKTKILEEGEVVIGTITNSQAEREAANKKQVGSLFGVPVTSGHDGQMNTTSETSQKKEWHIKYLCIANLSFYNFQ